MARRTRGFRVKCRKRLRKEPRQRGKLPLSNLLRQFEIGQRVRIQQEPGVHKGMPHPRFRGKTGKVVKQRGRAYVVEIMDGKKMKLLIASPAHLESVS